jgi:exodeoxyribonuclease VII large subunit
MNGNSMPEGVKVLSVSEVTQAIKNLVEDAFPSVWVAGEISNWKKAPSGHVYFTLKDADASLGAIAWRGIALRLRFEPHDGLDVIVRGRLELYVPQGRYNLVVEEMEPRGLGAQELALRQLKEKLFRLGYFDLKRKRPLPAYPLRVALVTSPTGAAVRDMLKVLGERWPGLEIYVCPVRVQGETSAVEIAAAVRLLDRLHGNGALPVDVLIVGRGGGSSEDLGAFNDEVVAQAIYRSRIPVVSAVGHEIDHTIADLVADRRAVTPTEAASLVAPDRGQLLQELGELEGRLREAVLRRLESARQRLRDLAERRAFRLPLERIHAAEQRLDDRAERLQRAVRQRLEQAKARLEGYAARLETLSPLNVLSRGYSLTRTEADGAVLRSPEQVRPGDRLVTHVQHGRLVSRVEEASPAVS